MARFRNDSGSVLNAAELGLVIGPGEELDSDLHVAGCTPLDAPGPESDDAPSPDGAGEGAPPSPSPKASGKRGRAADHDKETALCRF